MKKVMFIMAAVLLMMTQCKKENETPTDPAEGTVKMTVTAGPGRTSIDTENGAITWSAGDKLYVSGGTNWLGSLTLVSGAGTPQGTFTGSVTGLDDEGALCHFFYLGRDNGMTEPTAGTSTDAVISLATQDGTLAGAMKYHIGYGRTGVTVTEGEAIGSVVMNTKIAIAHINFTTDGTQAYTGSVTMGGTGVSNTLTVSPAGIFSGSGDGGDGIAIDKGDGTTGERFVTLIPTETADVLNVAFTGDATGSMTFAKGIHENKFYGMKDAIAVTLETHEYVDLGLPSGLLWATCNVGADSPEDYGWYFMWGSTTNGGDSICNWANCPGNGGNSSYNETAFNTWKSSNLTNNVLNPEVDAASVNWGGRWRMPTSDEFKELYDNTVCTLITENGVNGRKFASKTDAAKYIFLPAAGFRYGTDVSNAGSFGIYWSSSLNSSYPDDAYNMHFFPTNVVPQNHGFRYHGSTVRPVRVAR